MSKTTHGMDVCRYGFMAASLTETNHVCLNLNQTQKSEVHAIYYRPPKGKATISLSTTVKYGLECLEDNGLGLLPILKAIFSRHSVQGFSINRLHQTQLKTPWHDYDVLKSETCQVWYLCLYLHISYLKGRKQDINDLQGPSMISICCPLNSKTELNTKASNSWSLLR